MLAWPRQRLVRSLLCFTWVTAALGPVGWAFARQADVEVEVFWLAVCLSASWTSRRKRGAAWAVLFLAHAAVIAGVGHLFSRPMASDATAWRFGAFSLAGLAAMALVRYAYRRTGTWLLYNAAAQVGLVGVSLAHPVAGVILEFTCLTAMLALLALARREREATSAPFDSPRVAGAAFVILLCGGACALLAPRESLVPGMTRFVISLLVQAPTRTGYSLDDSHLGGSLVADPLPLLEIRAPSPLDLRGQVLSEYTGQGWASIPLDGSDIATAAVGQPLPDGLPFAHLPYRTMKVTVSLKGTVDTTDLLAPYAVDRVLKLPGLYGNQFAVDTVQGNIKAVPLGPGQSYELEAAVPADPYPRLASVRAPFAALRRDIPAMVRAVDTQLPAEFPRSVRQLAAHIVQQQHAVTEYDMVSAIIQYLAGHEQYEISDIPVPKPGQDYVAQFLFATHRGYCDNFASAAAVMLRALGVPARFATGFAVDAQNAVGPDTYVVTEADAHAWIEVYFPNFGWIPFDATPGFTMTFAPVSVPAHQPAHTKSSTGSPHHAKPPASPSGARLHLPMAASVAGGGVALLGGALWAARWVRRRNASARLGRDEFVRCVQSARAALGLPASATLRDLRPLAERAGASGGFDAWLRAAEAKLYGRDAAQQVDTSWHDLSTTLAEWLQAAKRLDADGSGRR